MTDQSRFAPPGEDSSSKSEGAPNQEQPFDDSAVLADDELGLESLERAESANLVEVDLDTDQGDLDQGDLDQGDSGQSAESTLADQKSNEWLDDAPGDFSSAADALYVDAAVPDSESEDRVSAGSQGESTDQAESTSALSSDQSEESGAWFVEEELGEEISAAEPTTPDTPSVQLESPADEPERVIGFLPLQEGDDEDDVDESSSGEGQGRAAELVETDERTAAEPADTSAETSAESVRTDVKVLKPLERYVPPKIEPDRETEDHGLEPISKSELDASDDPFGLNDNALAPILSNLFNIGGVGQVMIVEVGGGVVFTSSKTPQFSLAELASHSSSVFEATDALLIGAQLDSSRDQGPDSTTSIVVEGANGCVLLQQIDERHRLVVCVENAAGLGQVRFMMRRLHPRLCRSLSS